MSKLKDLYLLSKPGIIRGNLVHLIAGVLLAAPLALDIRAAFGVIFGTTLIIASACIVNNYIDRDIDAKMKRTKNRPSVSGSVPFSEGIAVAIVLFVAGIAIMLLNASLVVTILGCIAYVFYVVIYAVAKRRTTLSTLIGSIPGALPAMAGYVAMTDSIDMAAWAIFFVVLTWQMPHFYAISIYRKKEYKLAKLPVLGVVKSFQFVRQRMLMWQVIYIVAIAVMYTTGAVSLYGAGVLLIGALVWLIVSIRESAEHNKWAINVFRFSLLMPVLLLVSGTIDNLAAFMGALQ